MHTALALTDRERRVLEAVIETYVQTAEPAARVDVAAAIAKLREVEKVRAEAEAKMNGFLRELGYDA